MFNFGRLSHLARAINVDERIIIEVLDDFETNQARVVDLLTLWPADPNKKSRDVISVRGKWRLIQSRLYKRVFLPKLPPIANSHGGVRCRSPITNARTHLGNTFGYVTDVASFFPSISCNRVNQLFLRQACSYEVARILTRLCTYDFHLALGLITSPILANEIFKPIDQRIVHACRKMGLKYTRFVDDITISGKYDLSTSGIHVVVKDIVKRHGFKLAENKTGYGRFDKDLSITGVRLKKFQLDATRNYVEELERLLADHASLAAGGGFDGPLLTEGELLGKCHFVCGLNPGRRRTILSKYQSIDWDNLMTQSIKRGIVRRQSQLQPRGLDRPICAASPHSAFMASCLIESKSGDACNAPF